MKAVRVSPFPLRMSRLAMPGQLVIAQLRLYRSRLRERAYVARMSARDLRDIGMSRSDQIMLVEKPFWRE